MRALFNFRWDPGQWETQTRAKRQKEIQLMTPKGICSSIMKTTKEWQQLSATSDQSEKRNRIADIWRKSMNSDASHINWQLNIGVSIKWRKLKQICRTVTDISTNFSCPGTSLPKSRPLLGRLCITQLLSVITALPDFLSSPIKLLNDALMSFACYIIFLA